MPYTDPTVGLFAVAPPAGAKDHGYTYPEIDPFSLAGVPQPAPTFIDHTDASTYFATSFNAAAWAALTLPEQDTALAEATRWLGTLCWKGDKCDPTQLGAWPRTIAATGCCPGASCGSIPAAVIQATSELALALHQSKTAIIGGATSAGATQLIKRQKLGDLEVEYQAPTAGTVTAGRYGPNAPLVLQRFPWLGDLLGECYLQGSYGSSRIIGRVRS